MQIEIISFTEQGSRQAEKIEKVLTAYGEVKTTNGKQMKISLQQWSKEAFSKAQLLVFAGAVGIAVRAIAPFVRDKFTDPAVLVVDEKGTYVIPILSGHVGGANEYALSLAKEIGAEAVITTATDLNGRFAVDVFAGKNHLFIKDRSWAKEISVAVLQGEKIQFFCEKNAIGSLPEELLGMESEEKQVESSKDGGKPDSKHQILVGIHTSCHLIPRAVTLGIGCRRGKTEQEIEQFVRKQLEENQIALESISCVASVDKKGDEPGLLAFCEKYALPFQIFSAEQLKQAEGVFTESPFVEENIGVGNVCERAAVCAWREEKSHLILSKTAENGMTLAIAEKEWSVIFE